MDFGDFVIYADESGDHSLSKVDPGYPVFVLSLCVFRKRDYISRVVPAIQALKFKWFGHDAVILHEREIRQKAPPFEFLNEPGIRQEFMTDLSVALDRARMRVVASVIDKQRIRNEHLFAENPYHIALRFCLERLFVSLKSQGQVDRLTHCIFETRGRQEDKDLELEFLRIVRGANRWQLNMDCFAIRMVDKKANSSGLQIADLTARPIGLHVARPAQTNRAFEIVKPKMHLGRSKQTTLQVFP